LFTDLPTADAETPAPPESIEEPWWVDEVRSGLDQPGDYVAHRTPDDDYVGIRLRNTATRIGRGGTSHIRFDDPTVSRRHALIVRRPDGFCILDDRSLNGVFVNGERVEWQLLHDGDEILIGRHQLRFITVGADARGRAARRGEFSATS
jgi:pSer/pThr/pTyr-binding forkhead associated (FHA) protein